MVVQFIGTFYVVKITGDERPFESKNPSLREKAVNEFVEELQSILIFKLYFFIWSPIHKTLPNSRL